MLTEQDEDGHPTLKDKMLDSFDIQVSIEPFGSVAAG